jgi:hypothetical protein
MLQDVTWTVAGPSTVHVTSWSFLELLQCMLHLGTSWNCYSTCYVLELLGTATVHVTSWNFLTLLQFMLHLEILGTATVYVTSWNCYSSMLHLGTATVHVTSWNFLELLQCMLRPWISWNCCSSCYMFELLQFMLHRGTSCNCYSSAYILEFLGTATVHLRSWNFVKLLQFLLHLGTSWNCYSSCYILELLQFILHLRTPTVRVTYWNRYSSCYILELHMLELLQFLLHLEGRVTSSRTTPGETVYHIGCHCFTWEKLRTVTDYSKQKCTRYCSRMAEKEKTHNMHCRASNRMLVEIPMPGN